MTRRPIEKDFRINGGFLLIRKAAYVLGIMALVTGCATQKGPYLGTDGVYRLDGRSVWCAAASEEMVRDEARGKASEFCTKQLAQNAEVTFLSANGGIPWIQCATAHIAFKCVGKKIMNSPAVTEKSER